MSSPCRTFVLDTQRNRELLPVKAHFVTEDTFRDIMRHKVKDYAVYHKALATRQAGFNPEAYINETW